jgi:CBS domain-containing protein
VICPDCRFDNIEGVDRCENCGHDLRAFDQPGVGAQRGPDFIYHSLAEVPSRPPAYVEATDPVGFAVRIMQRADTNAVLVRNATGVAGIITPWDILHKVAGPNEDLNAVTCGQVMTADPVCLRDEDDVAVALNKMSIGGFRHIPLLQAGTPTAVLSITDVFQYIAPHLA